MFLLCLFEESIEEREALCVSIVLGIVATCCGEDWCSHEGFGCGGLDDAFRGLLRGAIGDGNILGVLESVLLFGRV